MRTKSVVAAAALGAAVLVVAATAMLPLRSGARVAAPARPLTVTTALTPNAVEFGDAVTARIVVTVDTLIVRASSLRVAYGVAPLTQLGAAVVHGVSHGSVRVLTYDVRAACLSDPCVAASGRRTISIGPVQITSTRHDGSELHLFAAWSPLTVSGRVAPTDLRAASPPFRADTTPPSTTYRVRPGVVAAALVVAAAVLAAAGATLAATAILRRRRPRADVDIDELARALLLAREARERPEPDRRAAAGYVARVLKRRDNRTATSADELAWSRPPPTADSLTQLVDDVEEERTT